MLDRFFFLLVFLLFSTKVIGQSKQVSFEKLFISFKDAWRNPLSGRLNDSVSTSLLYRTDQFNVSISGNPIAFDTNQLTLKNPYFSNDFDDYDDNFINFPVSYSVIVDKKLVSLFRNGKFVCHHLSNFERDLEFEKQLNSKKFKYHWIIDNKLAALASGKIYIWGKDNWVPLKAKYPIGKRPKLFEDDEYIVFGDCQGEFGGTVYFFDKSSKETFYTESTCANTVYEENGKYFILANLGHDEGSTEIKSIANPRKLTKTKKSEVNKTSEWLALGYSDKSMAFQKVLDFYGIQLFGTFKYKGTQLFMVYLNDLTFLAEIKGNEIQIVHPFFENKIYTHNPVTNSYGNYTLINLDFYGTALDKEVSVIIIDGNKITKVDWNK